MGTPVCVVSNPRYKTALGLYNKTISSGGALLSFGVGRWGGQKFEVTSLRDAEHYLIVYIAGVLSLMNPISVIHNWRDE